MSRKFSKFLLSKSILLLALSLSYSERLADYLKNENHQLLIDFTCATAKDELEKHPEMRTIAMVELENNFPTKFSREVLKCLPLDVAKVQFNPHLQIDRNSTLTLPKETLVVIIADQIEKSFDAKALMRARLKMLNEREMNSLYLWTCLQELSDQRKGFPHLSKYLVVTSGKGSDDIERKFTGFLNVVQIYEGNQKVIARSFDRTRNLPTFETFERSQRENLSEILFPDKTKNLNGQILHVPFVYSHWMNYIDGKLRGYWCYYLDIVAEKLNANLVHKQMRHLGDINEVYIYTESYYNGLIEAFRADRIDFALGVDDIYSDLVSYTTDAACCILPLPKPYDLTDLILILPLDKSCWMWLSITILSSTLIWRILEGHWNFFFGAFAYFVGQSAEIKTSRRILKILLQILIFTLFIFSNGYQSIVTSFMLEPEKHELLNTYEDVLDSDYKVVRALPLDTLYGDNPKYQKAIMEGRVIEYTFSTYNWVKPLIENKLTVFADCKDVKVATERYNGIYSLPEPVSSWRADLTVLPLHPYIEKFQELMDRSLEAGLHQAWTILDKASITKIDIKNEEKEEAKEILDLALIAPSLYILAFGLSAALVALLFEIFWKDFVTQLTKKYFKKKWNDIFGRKKQMRQRNVPRKLKVGRVQPRRSSI